MEILNVCNLNNLPKNHHFKNHGDLAIIPFTKSTCQKWT